MKVAEILTHLGKFEIHSIKRSGGIVSYDIFLNNKYLAWSLELTECLEFIVDHIKEN